METWIKLHRKLRDHAILRDPTALQIFMWILICVDYKTGTMVSGRFWAADELKMKPRTFHKALTERLRDRYDLVTLSSDNKNTIISVKNWRKYQQVSDTISDTSVTPKGQQSDTKQEDKEIKKIKNIDNGSIEPSAKPKEYGNKYCNLLAKKFEEIHGFKPTDEHPSKESWPLWQKMNTWLKRMDQVGAEEKIIEKYGNWIGKQDWSEGTQKMKVWRLKWPMYEAIVTKLVKERNETQTNS